MHTISSKDSALGKIPVWIKKHPLALLISGSVAFWVWNIASWYRWFYDIRSDTFREITVRHINWLLKWEKLSGPWECLYTENPLRIGIVSCITNSGKNFWPKTYDLKWLNSSMYTCVNLRLDVNWLLDLRSGNCFQWRITLLGIPEYLDKNGNVVHPQSIPWSSYQSPPEANQW